MKTKNVSKTKTTTKTTTNTTEKTEEMMEKELTEKGKKPRQVRGQKKKIYVGKLQDIKQETKTKLQAKCQ